MFVREGQGHFGAEARRAESCAATQPFLRRRARARGKHAADAAGPEPPRARARAHASLVRIVRSRAAGRGRVPGRAAARAPTVLDAAELALDRAAPRVDAAEARRLTRDQRVQAVRLDPPRGGGAFAG